MKKIFFLSAVIIFILNVGNAAFAVTKTDATKKKTKAKATNVKTLASLLPEADGVINVNTKKLFETVLPQIVKNPQDLANFNAELDNFKTRYGFDLRMFEEVSVAVKIKTVKSSEYDFEPYILGRGKFDSNELIEVAKEVFKGQYREEVIGGKSVYIFSAREILQENQNAAKNSKVKNLLGQAIKRMPSEIAVTSFDKNTLAMGTPNRLTEVLTTSLLPLKSETLKLLNRQPNAVIAFAGNLPQGMISNFIGLDNDDMGQTFASIRQMSGYLDMFRENVVLSLFAKTEQAEQAMKIESTLQGLQTIGKSLLGGGKTADKQVYERMIDNLQITRKLSEVNLNLQVAKSDLAILMK